MRRWPAWLCLAAAPALFCACGGVGGELPPESSEALPPSEEGAPGMSMSGIDLYMHDTDPTAGQQRKPRFWIHANTFDVLEDAAYAFKDARAVVFGEESGNEIVVFEADQGRFEEDKRAYLRDNVVAQVGTMTLQLEEVVWEQAGQDIGFAYSDHPVEVNDPSLRLRAASVRLYPETKEFELRDVEGHVQFNLPKAAATVSSAAAAGQALRNVANEENPAPRNGAAGE